MSSPNRERERERGEREREREERGRERRREERKEARDYEGGKAHICVSDNKNYHKIPCQNYYLTASLYRKCFYEDICSIAACLALDRYHPCY
jgi:hypothetical protein